MKLYGKLGIILAGCVLSIGISSTWAYYSDTESVVNPFHTTNSALDMVEDFNPAETMLPGETVDKKPSFPTRRSPDLILSIQEAQTWCSVCRWRRIGLTRKARRVKR